jgi:hypothetical protein
LLKVYFFLFEKNMFHIQGKCLFFTLAILAANFDVGKSDCRPFGNVALTFGTFFPNPTTLPGLQGTLTSPRYPSDYNAFEQCAYLIWGPTGSNVTITFQVDTIHF